MVGGGVYLFITQRPQRFQGDMATLVLGPLALVCLWPALALPKPSALTSSALCSPIFLLLFIIFLLDSAYAFTFVSLIIYCIAFLFLVLSEGLFCETHKTQLVIFPLFTLEFLW